MANVITSFLIGLGYDLSDLRRGEREAGSSVERVKSASVLAGAAITSAFVGVGKTAIDTANRVNDLRLNTNLLYTSTQYVNDYGNAIRSLGGNAGDAVSEISRVETALSNLRNKGDASTFTDLSYYGVDVQGLMKAESGGQFMEELSRQFPGLDRQQQAGVANTLGLSPASVELLRKGSDGYQQVLNHVHEVAGLSDELIDKSKQYNIAIGEAQTSWQGIANTISTAVLPGMTDVVNKGNDILKNVIRPMAERDPVATGAGLSMLGAGATATVAGPLLGAAGFGGAGAAVGALGLPVAALGLGTLGWNMNQQDVKNLTGYELPSYLWDKQVFDESAGDTAGGLLHSDSFLGRMWNSSAPTSTQGTGYTQDYLRGVQNNANPYGNNSFTPPGMIQSPQGWNAGDALDQDYEAQKRTYLNTDTYAPETGMSDYNSASAVGEAVAEKLYSVPLKATVNNNVDLRVELDGRALDSKITEVQQRNNQMTVDDMQSTTAR